MNITQLWRYPVKSLAGEQLSSAPVAPGGIRFDRQYMIVDGDERRQGEVLTARQVAKMLAFQGIARDGLVCVKTPEGDTLPCNNEFASKLEHAIGRAVSIQATTSAGEAFHDAHDILVLNAASLRALEHEWGKALNPLRFRPNIIVDGDEALPYVENGWVGRCFQAGKAIFEGAAFDQRCMLTTIDPQTLAIDPSLLRLIVERHNQCFGLYCRVQTPGNIAVGDEWLMLE